MSVVLYVKLGIALGLPSTAPVRLSPVILPKADLYSKGGSCKLSTSFLLPSAAAAGVPGGTRASGVQSHRHRGGHEEGGEGHGPREAGGAARHVQTFHRHRGPHGRHHYDPYVGLARCLFCSECMFKLLGKLSLYGFHLFNFSPLFFFVIEAVLKVGWFFCLSLISCRWSDVLGLVTVSFSLSLCD